ncbi:MAG: hypothetical protein AAF582_00195 [Pseudomonadota bacterium]
MTDTAPIFIGRARSFWFGVMTFFLAFTQAGSETLEALAAIVGPTLGFNVDASVSFAKTIFPLLTFIAVFIERRGGNRPYTWKMNRETVS